MIKKGCHTHCPTQMTDEEVYGFKLMKDRFYYTADPSNPCCATKVRVTNFNAEKVEFTYEDGKPRKDKDGNTIKSAIKERSEFMKSSWLDKSPNYT